MEFVELTQGEVENLDFGCESFLQSWEMFERYRQTGREAYFVGVKDEGGKVLAAGLMQGRGWHFGKKIFRVAGGWLMRYSNERIADNGQTSASEDASLTHRMSNTARSATPSSLNSTHSRQLSGAENRVYSWREVLKFMTMQAREFCRKKGGIAIEIAPNIMSRSRDAHNQIVEGEDNLAVKDELEKLGYKYLGEYEQVKWTFVLDVAGKKPEEVFAAFRTDHRQRIRRAEREGVRVRELRLDELGILKEIAAEAGERHGFQDPDVEYYETMKRAFGDKIKFVVAELPGEKLDEGKKGEYVPLAAAMFVIDKNEIIYLYSGSVRSLQKYGGAHLIQWKMIQEAIERGCEKYNFYGVYPVEGNGVYNFKLGFRGRVEELLGTFVLPVGVLGEMYAARLKYREYGELH